MSSRGEEPTHRPHRELSATADRPSPVGFFCQFWDCCLPVLAGDSGSVMVPEQEAIVTSEELGQDLEHVEVLQKKFEEFQTDMAAHEERVNEVNQFAAKLIQVRTV